jgi:hypothetical protein
LEQWITFAQDRWYWIIGAVIVLFIVIGLVKTVIKWILVVAIIGALILYGANYKDQLQTIGASVVSKAGAEAKVGVEKAIAAEAKDAKYTANPDGTFVIMTKSLQVEGKLGSNDVQVTFMGAKFTMKADGVIQTFIEQAMKNSKS